MSKTSSIVQPVSLLLARVDAAEHVEAAVGRIDRRHRAGAAQRRGDGRAGREALVEELPVVVEERIGVDEVRREDLADRVLEPVPAAGSAGCRPA